NGGKAAVYLDGVFQANVELYSAKKGEQCYSLFLPATYGPHTLKVEVTGQRSGNSTDSFVTVDWFASTP
ncbi:MAG: hypothetical protein HC908_09700, partial [Calothrix sp. SM1_7_51]|nr:hypothetical protein [Calothrix sp. SM1_7_51]